MDGKHSIELFRVGGKGAGIETLLAREERLDIARFDLQIMVRRYPGRVVMLCDRARMPARSDRPETMPLEVFIAGSFCWIDPHTIILVCVSSRSQDCRDYCRM